MQDKVQCPICEKFFKIITIFHIKTHGFSSMNDFKEYLKNNNLGCQLVSELTAYNMSKHLIGSKRPDHSIRMSGVLNPLYGKKRTDNEKLLISKNRIGKGLGHCGIYERTNEIRSKISLGVSQAHSDGFFDKFNKFYKKGYHTKVSGIRVFYRSSWEKEVMEFLDKHPNVIYWEYEPFRIPYEYAFDAEDIRYYIPDFYIKFDHAVEIWEIKPEYKLHQDVFFYKRRAMHNYIRNKQNGVDNFVIISDEKIANLKKINWDKIYTEYYGRDYLNCYEYKIRHCVWSSLSW